MNQKITELRNFSRVGFLNILLEGIYYSHKQHKIRAYLVFCIDLINFGQANFAVFQGNKNFFSTTLMIESRTIKGLHIHFTSYSI